MTALHTESTAVDKFTAPLYTQSEAARFLDLSTSTFRNWARGRNGAGTDRGSGSPVLTTVNRTTPHGPNIPFVGLAEGYALSAIRRTGVPLQRIRPALERLGAEMGVQHALASKQLFTDGAEVLFDHAQHADQDEADAVRELVVVRDGQRVFTEVVRDYLTQIVFGHDGFATAIPLLGFRKAELVADVKRSFGQPIFRHGGVKLEDAISLFKAERDIGVVSDEYGIPRAELEDVLAVLVN